MGLISPSYLGHRGVRPDAEGAVRRRPRRYRRIGKVIIGRPNTEIWGCSLPNHSWASNLALQINGGNPNWDFTLKMKTDSSFSWSPKKLQSSLNVVIVGGTGGLGQAISHKLAEMGAKVTAVGQTFRDKENPNIDFVQADLSSIKTAAEMAHNLDVSNTDIVLFTAGIFAAPNRQETSEGLERDTAVSFLNRKVIIDEIAPRMRLGLSLSTPRIFNMAYPGDNQLGNIADLNAEHKYSAMSVHMTTVAGNEALVYDSVTKYPNVHFYGLNPGIVKTNIRNNFLGANSWKSSVAETLIGWFTRTPDQYAAEIAPLLYAVELESQNGRCFNNNAKLLVRSKGMTDEYARKFMKAADDLLREKKVVQ